MTEPSADGDRFATPAGCLSFDGPWDGRVAFKLIVSAFAGILISLFAIFSLLPDPQPMALQWIIVVGGGVLAVLVARQLSFLWSWWSIRIVPEEHVELGRGKRGQVVIPADEVVMILGQFGLRFSTSKDPFPWVHLDLATTGRTHRTGLKLPDVEKAFDVLRRHCPNAVAVTPEGFVYLPLLPGGQTDLEWLAHCRQAVASGFGRQSRRLFLWGTLGLIVAAGYLAMQILGSDAASLLDDGQILFCAFLGALFSVVFVFRAFKSLWSRWRVLGRIDRAMLHPDEIHHPDGGYKMLGGRR